MKTHVVIDLTYHEDEFGHECFVGTEQECYDHVSEQNTFGLEVKPLTQEEIKIHNS